MEQPDAANKMHFIYLRSIRAEVLQVVGLNDLGVC